MKCMKEYCEEVNEENEEGEEEVRRVPKVPLFYKENQESRGNKEGNYVVDTTIRCPMQILYEIIDLGVERQDPKVTTKFSDVFEYAYNSKIKKNYGKQLERVEKLISKYNLQIKSVDPKLEDCFEKKCMIFNDYMKKMLKWKIKQETMNYLVDYAFKNTDVCDNMLIMLYKYDVDMLGTKNIIIVQLYLGFRRSQRVNLYLRAIVNDLMESGDIDKQPQKYTTTKGRNVGDFSFVIVQEELSPETELISAFDKTMIQMRVALQNVTSSPASWFGLEFADVVNEKVPLILGKRKVPNIRRMRHKSNN